MRFLVALILTMLLAFISGLYFPWWGIALAAFITAILVRQKPGRSFIAGFLALLLLWGGLAWFIDHANNSLLSARIGQVLKVGSNSLLLVLLTGIVGGLVAGLSALSGSYLVARKD